MDATLVSFSDILGEVEVSKTMTFFLGHLAVLFSYAFFHAVFLKSSLIRVMTKGAGVLLSKATVVSSAVQEGANSCESPLQLLVPGASTVEISSRTLDGAGREVEAISVVPLG